MEFAGTKNVRQVLIHLRRERTELLEQLAFDLTELQTAKIRGKVEIIDELIQLLVDGSNALTT